MPCRERSIQVSCSPALHVAVAAPPAHRQTLAPTANSPQLRAVHGHARPSPPKMVQPHSWTPSRGGEWTPRMTSKGAIKDTRVLSVVLVLAHSPRTCPKLLKQAPKSDPHCQVFRQGLGRAHARV